MYVQKERALKRTQGARNSHAFSFSFCVSCAQEAEAASEETGAECTQEWEDTLRQRRRQSADALLWRENEGGNERKKKEKNAKIGISK